jgi:hypothetical protein
MCLADAVVTAGEIFVLDKSASFCYMSGVWYRCGPEDFLPVISAVLVREIGAVL